MARKTTKTKPARTLPDLSDAAPIDNDTMDAIRSQVPQCAGEETIIDREANPADGHTGYMTIALGDGSQYLVNIDVIGNWDDWCLLGAKLTKAAEIDPED